MADSYSVADHEHMARALRLAALGRYSAAPNPAVGCVLTDSAGRVVGEGWHRRTGEPHAEVLALAASQGRERGGTAYVTLEPCAHHGRTPPCVDAVLAAAPGRVVVAMEDPNPRVAGQGIRRLREAGVPVHVGLLAAAAAELNRGFVSRMTRARPWVTVKLGSSLDGRTALADGSSKWITGPHARADVQRLRAQASAVLTGIGTVLADDPALTVRDPRFPLHGRRPLRVIFDARGQLPPRARLLNDDHDTLVLTSRAGAAELQAHGVHGQLHLELELLPVDAHGRLDPAVALARLAERQCNEVLVESGARLAGSFLSAGLVDELVVYLAATVLGQDARPSFSLPQPIAALEHRARFDYHDVRTVGGDLRVTLRPAREEGV
ncbi:MAG TPA: bifunctional diaminohydroxyphosphoribosylaminopyrimidine deaminase/5-amino-6-(5-phosphoribosylamino)uracil reductase RibD [Steroidobacteraceae bacterium]|nr:bifunctional diaminohydroxyphosphoribosylaminopyrimidine deaminase/5-amino-6-(5-phosphoribosylamino)uracil reductase RibD [Steroidobacteraceae bacterium]